MPSKGPTVTIVVPTYDRPDLLAESIGSAIAQTYEDWVMLVGDNGGSPRNEGVVKGFGDPRIHYLRHPDGLGPQGNWLELVRRSETAVVGTMHDDDTWRPTFLEKVLPPLLDDPTVSIAFSDYWVIDEAGDIQVDYTEDLSRRTHRGVLPAGRVAGTRADALRLVAVWNACQPVFAGLVRRDAIVASTFPDEIAPIYDLWLSYQVVCRVEGLYYVPERLTNYRVWDQSLTAGDPIAAEDEVFRRITEECADMHPVVDEVHRRWAELRYGRAGRMMNEDGRREASRHELREASAHLDGLRKGVAVVGASSTLGWNAVRLGRNLGRRGPEGVRSWLRGRNAPLPDEQVR
jgi:glycosyltransferase involved in cell wall biosynthesis